MNRSSSVKKVCTLGLLTAITVILAIFCTLRIGDFIKIPFKFISVFLTAAVFGPFWGGTVAAIGDILNTAFSTVIYPLITAVEFLYGFVFGILFYKKPFKGKGFYLRALLCTVIVFFIDCFITSYILTLMGKFQSFKLALYTRFIVSIIKALLHFAFIVISPKFQIQKLWRQQ